MDVKEFRIGSLLYNKETDQVIKCRILREGMELYKHYIQIPITEEWLIEKAGFIKVNGWDDIIIFIKDGIELEFINGRFYNHCDTELKYVHQVQNYYYSSKLIELQINK